MPTYEYGCSNCGNEWELEQRITANPIRKCPKCKKLKAQRLISRTNFITKGDGWFADLYSKPAPGSKSKDSSESSSSSGSSSESKAEPKADKPKKKKKKGKSDAA